MSPESTSTPEIARSQNALKVFASLFHSLILFSDSAMLSVATTIL